MTKLFSLLALALVLSACGNSADKPAEEPTETTTTEAPAEEATEEEAPAEEEAEEEAPAEEETEEEAPAEEETEEEGEGNN